MSEFQKFIEKLDEAIDEKEYEITSEVVINCPCCNESITIINEEFAMKTNLLEEDEELNEEWKTLPKGWTKESLDKFAKSLTGKTKGDSEGFVRACIPKMKGKVTDAAAYCASLKDKVVGKTTWRGPKEEVELEDKEYTSKEYVKHWAEKSEEMKKKAEKEKDPKKKKEYLDKAQEYMTASRKWAMVG